MEARRRTLAADPAHGNQAPMSHIPLPSSAMKRPAMRSSHTNLRQSLAPGTQFGVSRMSVAGGGLSASQQSSSQASQDGGVAVQGSLSGPARRSTMVNRASVQG